MRSASLRDLRLVRSMRADAGAGSPVGLIAQNGAPGRARQRRPDVVCGEVQPGRAQIDRQAQGMIHTGPTACAAACFEQDHPPPCSLQRSRRCNAGGASTHDRDVKGCHAESVYLLTSLLMKRLDELLSKNRQWAANQTQQDPEFFSRLVNQQSPRYLWIGCADSRVPANEIVDLAPGELFVHRNVANLVVHTDLNCLSVIQYAVDVLKVEDIIVTGHYGCGGVAAAMGSASLGLIDNWLRHVQDIRDRHPDQLLAAGKHAVDRLCELNVLEQALNVCRTTVVKDAWARGQDVAVHGLIYSVADGLLRDLNFRASADTDSSGVFEQALVGLRPPRRSS